jgi:thiol-disulfide isomerase/thioredoxin
MTVPDQASFLTCYFVSKDAWGGPAYTMVYTPQGKPARDAWHESMFAPSMQKDYRERTARELALYPDNWAVYRDKWFSAGAFEVAEREFMIRADLPAIEHAAGRPLGALYAMSYGHLLLGEEAAALAILREMVERFPDESLTASALESYTYEDFVHHFAGEGPKQVTRWSVDFIRRHPESATARESLDGVGAASLPADVVEPVCRAWMKEQPQNPKPYYLLAQALHATPAEALPLAERALDLLAAGQLRLHGDVYGKMTARLLPSVYASAANHALALGEFAKALAYAKAAETTGSETDGNGFRIEARTWEKLGRAPNAAAAWKEAWQRGDESAHQILLAKYSEALKENVGAAKRKQAPSFQLTSLDGAAVDSAQLRGKIVVANFWFTGCGPCKAEIPDLNRLVQEFAGKDVVFLAFSLDEDAAVLRRFLKEYPFEYTIVPRADKVAAAFGIESYPSHVIIGADGEIESMLVGGGEHRAQELRTVIARLIN